MTKEYLKMADAFCLPVDSETSEFYCSQSDPRNIDLQSDYASHSINSHDELVAEVERLREHLKLCAIELSVMIDRYNVHNMEDDSWLYDHQTPWDAMQLLK